jgi:hypothetical protein
MMDNLLFKKESALIQDKSNLLPKLILKKHEHYKYLQIYNVIDLN